jgi:hypothetical protein
LSGISVTEQLVGGLRQHAGDVQADVAGADDGDRLGLSGHSRGTSGWPSNQDTNSAPPKLPVQVDPGDVEVAVLLGAGREHDRVVVAAQVLELDVDAVLHVAEQPDLRLAQHLVQRLDDALDARVVRRDAVADEAERRGLALVQVDGHGVSTSSARRRRRCRPGPAPTMATRSGRSAVPWARHGHSSTSAVWSAAQNAQRSHHCS